MKHRTGDSGLGTGEAQNRHSPESRVPSPESRFLVIGHRGAAGHAPENTLRGFEAAIRLGAHWIELDVQHHDDALLVIHDPRLERTTNGSGRLSDRPLDYIRGLDAGGGERIPTLPETLDCIDRRAGVNIELKSEGAAPTVAAVLRDYIARRGWNAGDFLVSSFHLPELAEFKRQAPEIPRGVLLCGVPLDLAACATALGARALCQSWEFVTPALLADARRRGLKVYVYTVNEPGEIAKLREQGIDGVFTDYPERAISHCEDPK